MLDIVEESMDQLSKSISSEENQEEEEKNQEEDIDGDKSGRRLWLIRKKKIMSWSVYCDQYLIRIKLYKLYIYCNFVFDEFNEKHILFTSTLTKTNPEIHFKVTEQRNFRKPENNPLQIFSSISSNTLRVLSNIQSIKYSIIQKP